MKVCTRCGVDKPLSDFYSEPKGKYGVRSRCKPCMVSEAAEWRKHNKPNLDPELAYARYKRWIEKNKEWEKAYRKKRSKLPEERAKRRAYLKRSGKSVEYAQRRRAQIREAEGSYTAEEWEDLCAKYDYRCLACGADEVTVDHIVPLSKGGSNMIDNLQPLCMSCNCSKQDRVVDYRLNNDTCDLPV